MAKKKEVKPTIKKKQRPLTIKQRKFVDEVVKSGNATDAAMKVYNCKNRTIAKSVWPENLAKPCIKEAIEDRLNVAKNVIYKLAVSAEKEETQLRAAQDIIDRWEWKAIQRVIQDTKVTLDVESATPEELLAFIKK